MDLSDNPLLCDAGAAVLAAALAAAAATAAAFLPARARAFAAAGGGRLESLGLERCLVSAAAAAALAAAAGPRCRVCVDSESDAVLDAELASGAGTEVFA